MTLHIAGPSPGFQRNSKTLFPFKKGDPQSILRLSLSLFPSPSSHSVATNSSGDERQLSWMLWACTRAWSAVACTTRRSRKLLIIFWVAWGFQVKLSTNLLY